MPETGGGGFLDMSASISEAVAVLKLSSGQLVQRTGWLGAGLVARLVPVLYIHTQCQIVGQF